MEEELDIYTEKGMENYVDDDMISDSEEGFMIGYLGAWKCLIFVKRILWNGKSIRKK